MYKILICFLAICLALIGCERRPRATRQELAQEEMIIGFAVGYNPRIAEIQLALKQAGFDPGAFDGTMNPSTRDAIAEFQKSRALRQTGVIDDQTWALLKPPVVAPPPPPPVPVQPAVQRPAVPERPTVKDIQVALRNAGFYKGPISGVIGPKTRSAIKDFQRAKNLTVDGIVGRITWGELSRYFHAEQPTPPPTPAPVPAQPVVQQPPVPAQPVIQQPAPAVPEPPTVRDIQRALRNAGFYHGPISGVIGPKTRSAIKSFQRANNLTVDGIVGRRTWAELSRHLTND
jgi:peptidoglycan hydrolase-like protein with peptidoglycan-binding domain